jgi:hypothetical protein
MGAMKRLLESVYETLQDDLEGFRRLGMDQQFDAACVVAQDLIDVGPMKNDIQRQIIRIAEKRGL